MNKFDERYDIRLAKKEDIEDIMEFIHNYWSKGHIMSCDRELFEYEFLDGDSVNFIIAIEKSTQEIEGIFGFLRCSNTEDITKKDIWGSIWKVNDTHKNTPFLGVELAKRAYVLTQCRFHIGSGANPKTTVPLRKMFFKDKAGKMKQFYLLNEEIKEYKIAKISNKNRVEGKQSTVSLKIFDSIEEVKAHFDIESIDAIPYKDEWYLNKRFFEHPYYKYTVYGVLDSNQVTKALMVTKIVTHEKSKVMRIVDYIGDQSVFAGLYGELNRLLKENQCEYVDFYTFGFEDKYILEAGLALRGSNDANIIPNYFEPFLQQNVDIWVHYSAEGTLFFKADCDQDRPNQIRNKNQENRLKEDLHE